MHSYLEYQKRKYPLSTDQDQLVQLYQSCYGKISFFDKPIHPFQGNLYDVISKRLVRIHLNVYLQSGFSLSKLKDLTSKLDLISYQEELFFRLCQENNLIVPQTINHSQLYQEAYTPNYILALKKDLTPEMIAYQLNYFLKQQPASSIVALEGRCGSGKSTISNLITPDTGFMVIPIDDFFLPDYLKTTSRLQEIGGNIHYEAILDLLFTFKKGSLTHYQAYSCSNCCFIQKELPFSNKILLEGVYSYHPAFRHLIDKLSFLDINQTDQIDRIKQRKLANRFFDEWIPLEERYFETEKIIELADVIL